MISENVIFKASIGLSGTTWSKSAPQGIFQFDESHVVWREESDPLGAVSKVIEVEINPGQAGT